MKPSREELKQRIDSASSKEKLLLACAEYREHYPESPVGADPEGVAVVAPLLASVINATSGAVFKLPFSIRLLARMMAHVRAETEQGAYVLIDAKAWEKFVADSELYIAVDPVCSLSILLSGRLGAMYGTEIYSDMYYRPELRTLPENSITVMSKDGTSGIIVHLA